MRFASWITKARTDTHTHTHTHTHVTTTTHIFSKATTVTRTRLCVKLYVPCLSCSIISSSILSPLFNLHSPPSYEFML